jgi:hypothetical protein
VIEELKSVLTTLGLSPALISVVVLLAGILIYLVKMRLDLQSSLEQVKATAEATYNFDRQAKIDDRLFDYAREQGKALKEAYRMVFENEEVQPTKRRRFVEIVKEADDKIMEPFTDFSTYLDEDIQSRIYAVHWMLDQMTYDPSEGAIRDFLALKASFYNDYIEEATKKMNEIVRESRVVGDKR